MEQPEKPAGMTIEECADLGRRSLFFFTKVILGYDQFSKSVHGPICRALQDIRIARLNATFPRKFFKSTLITIGYPLWRGINDPNIEILVAMNTVDNAKYKLGELQQHVESNQFFRACYQDVIPDFNKNWSRESCSLRRTSLSGTPTYQIAGATTRVTSRVADEIVMDDLLTVKEGDGQEGEILPNQKDIEQAIVWYQRSLSLLKDPLHGRLLNVGTRWAPKDLVEYVLRTNKRFRENNFELRAVEGEWGTPECRATFPEKYPMEALQELAETQGSTIFRLWYLNEPVDPSELVFRLDDNTNFYNPTEKEAGWVQGLRCYTAVDLAFSDKESADNSAIVTIGVDSENTRYVLDVIYGKYDPMQLVEFLFSVYETFRPHAIGIEKVAAQVLMSKFLPHFMRERDVALPIRDMPRGRASKGSRLVLGIQPWLEQGMVKLPRGCAKALERELLDYRLDEKRSGHDDALDALSDAIALSQKGYSAEPQKPKRRILTDEDWAAFYAKLYSVDEAVAELEREANRTDYFCNPGEFQYMRDK